jgi:hypothetical protein
MPAQLESFAYFTPTAIAMLYVLSSEELKQRNAILVLELVTQKLKEDLRKPPKSLAALRLRDKQTSNLQNGVSKVETCRQIKKTLRAMKNRLETTLAASLVETTSRESTTDGVEQVINTETDSENSIATESVVDEQKRKMSDMVEQDKQSKARWDELGQQLVVMESKVEKLTKPEQKRELESTIEEIRGMIPSSEKKQKTS